MQGDLGDVLLVVFSLGRVHSSSWPIVDLNFNNWSRRKLR